MVLGLSTLVVHDGQSQLCLANMCPAGPLDFSSIVPDRGTKCLGRRGLVASCQFSHIPGTQPHSHTCPDSGNSLPPDPLIQALPFHPSCRQLSNSSR